jgi:hypothetical protein
LVEIVQTGRRGVMWLFEGLAATALLCAIMIVVLSRALLLFVPAKRMALLGGLIKLRLAE